jgi:superfamily II DNA/RNA helicase
MAKLPTERQSLCFSATITPEINRLIDGILKSPETVSVRTGETASHVDQDVIVASSKEEKLAKLLELLAQPDYDKVLVFSQTKWGAQRLAEMITAVGYKAEAIHGNKTQAQRQKALRSFKEGNVSVLVATDVAARGLDISNVSHVINFDQPNTYQDYVHRIGRTGRAGKKGKALTFVSHHP